jgi:hypothetical protein
LKPRFAKSGVLNFPPVAGASKFMASRRDLEIVEAAPATVASTAAGKLLLFLGAIASVIDHCRT